MKEARPPRKGRTSLNNTTIVLHNGVCTLDSRVVGTANVLRTGAGVLHEAMQVIGLHAQRSIDGVEVREVLDSLAAYRPLWRQLAGVAVFASTALAQDLNPEAVERLGNDLGVPALVECYRRWAA